MSLILDALRKSEAERRRGQSPDLFGTSGSPPALRRDGFRHWPVLAGGALVLVAVALLLWPHASPDDADTPNPASVADVVPDEDANAGAARVEAIPMSVPAQAPPALKAPKSTPVADPSPPAPSLAVPVAPSPVPAPSAALPPPANAEPAPPVDDLPTLAILAPSERAALPPLKLSMHVWNSDPPQRFAIVDGQRLIEGATIGGAVVAEIRRDGVVLDVNGRRVLLPRP